MDKLERRESLAHSYQILYALKSLKKLQDPESVKFNSKKVAFVLDSIELASKEKQTMAFYGRFITLSIIVTPW